MPKRTDISKILIIGSGPIVIGQSAEFDYSGTQACKALKSEGFEVVLANSNPATIMTDPEIGRPHLHRAAYAANIWKRSSASKREMSPSAGFAVLPTVGGQTALNLAIELADGGVLEKYNVSLIGAQARRPSRRRKTGSCSRTRCSSIGLDVPQVGAGEQPERRHGVCRQDRLSGDYSAVVHAGRHRRRHRLQPRRAGRGAGPRPGPFARARGAD